MRKLKTLVFIFILMVLLVPLKVFAAGEVSFTVSGASVKQGQSFSVNVNETGATDANTLYSFTMSIEFDNSVIQYTGGNGQNGANVSASGNTITISMNNQVTSNSSFATLNFKALKEGNTNLRVFNTSCSINGSSSSCGFPGGSSIKVSALGSDSKLSGLSIPNTTLSPAFNKNTYDYTADVKDVTQLSINATAVDPNAKIQISDNYRKLQKGENTINIVVTAENGKNKSTYKIVVNVELTPTEEELLLANASLSSIEIKDQKLDFSKDEIKYYLNVPYNVTSLDITATPENPKATVNIAGNDKLIVGKNTVNITVTAEDTKTTKTYSILVTRLEENKKIIKTCPDTTSVLEWIIFSIGLFITFTLGIVLGYILCKKGIIDKIFKKKNNEEEPVEIQTLSDTIDLSEVVEEIKDENE